MADPTDILREQIYAVANEWQRPSVMYRAKFLKEGDKWCCLIGENIQDGVCAFGDSPQQAALYLDFYAWLGKEQPK